MKMRIASLVNAPGGHVTALCLVQFAGVRGVTAVVTAPPRMLAGFGVPVSPGALILTSYAMCALNTAAQLGTAAGVGALLLLATDTARTTAALRGIPLGWAAAAIIAAAGAILLVRTGRRRTSQPAREDEMQTVTLGATQLEVTAGAGGTCAGGGRAL
jgi:hypothetical protein